MASKKQAASAWLPTKYCKEQKIYTATATKICICTYIKQQQQKFILKNNNNKTLYSNNKKNVYENVKTTKQQKCVEQQPKQKSK